MNLDLFHQPGRPDRFHKTIDRRINRTGRICYYYEMSGSYDVNLAMRLLGHYRLFQLGKNNYPLRHSDLSPEKAYIVHYRENNILKNTWVYFISFLRLVLRIDYPEVNSINRTLLFKRPEILQNFLISAQIDFDKALIDALDQISHPAFLSELPLTNVHLQITENHEYNNTLTNNVHLEITENHHHTTLAKNENHVHANIKEEAPPQKPAKGKEEGVFSKKQVLIILDLLAAAKAIEPIDFKKNKNSPAIAALLRALTGHGEESWRDELKNYHTKTLYEWNSNGQRMELIRILSNLSEKFSKAGFNTVAKLAEKKIMELERAAP